MTDCSHVPSLRYRDHLERELERRILISEQRRSAMLGWIIAAVFAARVIYQVVYGQRADVLPGRASTLIVLGGLGSP